VSSGSNRRNPNRRGQACLRVYQQQYWARVKAHEELNLHIRLAVLARGQGAISLKEAVRQSMVRSKVLEAWRKGRPQPLCF
jgi:hypothetical protein